jgi:putative phage-type endonuclease
MTAAARTSTVDMPREEWLALRNTGIGSSDAASVVGLNPYKSNFALYEEKVGLREPDDLSDNEAVHWGLVLEEPIAQEFAVRTGRKVRRVNALLRHPDYPFMLANLDRELVAEDGDEPEILECKTAGLWAANAEEWGPDESDEVPERYLIQVMHQLAVRGRRRAHVAALIGGQELRIYTIRRNETLIAALIEKEKEFWRAVQTRTAPTIIDLSDARRAFPISREGEIEATAEIFDAVLRLREAKRVEKETSDDVKRLQGLIAGFMGEHDTLVRGGRKILTWRTIERKEYSVAPSSFRQFRLVGEIERESL